MMASVALGGCGGSDSTQPEAPEVVTVVSPAGTWRLSEVNGFGLSGSGDPSVGSSSCRPWPGHEGADSTWFSHADATLEAGQMTVNFHVTTLCFFADGRPGIGLSGWVIAGGAYADPADADGDIRCCGGAGVGSTVGIDSAKVSGEFSRRTNAGVVVITPSVLDLWVQVRRSDTTFHAALRLVH